MKHIKIITFTLFIVLLVSVFAGCSLPQSLEDKELRAYTDEMLQYIISDDFSSAYSLVSDAYTKDEFAYEFIDMQHTLYEVEEYELKLMSINKNSNTQNGITLSKTSSTYKLLANDNTYVVSVERNSDCEKLSYFFIEHYENTKLYSTGTISNMNGASPLQWLIVLLNIPVSIVTIYALVDCCRNDIKKKVLWVFIIILGCVVASKTLSSSGFNSMGHLGLFFSASSLKIFGDGSIDLNIAVPVGAIIYLCVRKQLKKDDTNIVDSVKPQNTITPVEYRNSPNDSTPNQ